MRHPIAQNRSPRRARRLPPPVVLAALLACGLAASGCFQDFLDEPADGAAADRPAAKTDPAAARTEGPGPAPAAAGAPAEPIAPGPFVEPPLEQRPQELVWVVAARAARPWELGPAFARLAASAAVPIGYPAVDQAASLAPGAKGFVLVAGKFARRRWAEALRSALRDAGIDGLTLVARPYRFDRHKPALNAAAWPRAGRIFAGLAGQAVPLLAAASEQAQGTGQQLADGALVQVLGERFGGRHLWYQVQGPAGAGFLPAGRVLVDANVDPAADGRAAVLGVGLGCQRGVCRWDYWLTGRGFGARRLLKSAGERMPHAFSPDGRWLAYTTFDPSILVTATSGQRTIELGPGISPSFSADGRLLYFRGPGVKGRRDAVRASAVADWDPADPAARIRTVLDYPGRPFYPRAISTVPPQVDFLGPGELFTLFYRRAEKNGRRQIQRWGVRFTPDGRILEKAGVAISD